MARGDYLKSLTPDEMKAFQAKRIATMQAKKAAKKADPKHQTCVVKVERTTDYPVSNFTDKLWTEQAAELGIRLPHRSTPASTGGLTNFLRRAGIPIGKYNTWTGFSLKEQIEANPNWPLRAMIGIAIEHRDLILA